jgi:ABC-type nitrate/sulfonate/bicarbonate transport system ATPase subunit
MARWAQGAVSGYIGDVTIVDQISLPISSNSITAVFGPSGSGKTSLLRMIAGLWDGRTVGLEIGRGFRVGYVAQRDFLFPWMTLGRNVEFPATLTGIPPSAARPRLEELSERFMIGNLLGRFPYQVSGGELQRALIVRALAAGASLLLLDEPMNSLDVAARIALRESLRSAVSLGDLALVLVTHELPDAISIADTICLCSGPPLRLERVLTRTSDSNFSDDGQNLTAEQARLLIESELAKFALTKRQPHAGAV